ncbi:hypothetical protein [Pseudonocardia sp.]|uniref:hypothetical protein n=1 Tax=Pseudonocardia sp. TaxID=60912 RepID=UPI0031FDD6A9
MSTPTTAERHRHQHEYESVVPVFPIERVFSEESGQIMPGRQREWGGAVLAPLEDRQFSALREVPAVGPTRLGRR